MSTAPNRILRLATRIVVPLLVLAIGFAIYGVLAATAPEVKRSDHGAQLLRARVFEARRVPVQRQWQGYGTAEAKDSADVPARVTATVERVPPELDAGVAVKRGDLIVQLDESDFRHELDAAQQALAQLQADLELWNVEEAALRDRLAVEQRDAELAESELARVRSFVSQGGGSQQDVDRAERNAYAAERTRLQVAEELARMPAKRLQLEAQVAGQRSAVARAQLNLDRCAIRAPIDGILQELSVEAGESVSAGERVARVVDLKLIDVPIQLPSAARPSVHVGDAATVSITGRRGQVCPAVVTRVAPEDDPSSRTMTVYVTVDQSQFPAAAPLSPGTFVAASVVSDTVEERWVVPRRALRGGRVFVVANGLIQNVPVDIDFALQGAREGFGLEDNEWAVLADESPLKPGDLVLVNASQSVMDGQAVEPIVSQVPGPASPVAEQKAALDADAGHGPRDVGPIREATP